MTLEALMTATAFEPAFRPSSSMAAFVIDEEMTRPGATSILTMPFTAPSTTSTTVPGSWLRAESFMMCPFVRIGVQTQTH